MSGQNGRPPDAIDAGIAAVGAQPAPAGPYLATEITLGSTHRKIAITTPVDMTEVELLDFIGYLGTSYLTALRKAANPARSRLVLPGGG